jgi:protein-S-isoprenylcysteine O-methyltransferase Ste14
MGTPASVRRFARSWWVAWAFVVVQVVLLALVVLWPAGDTWNLPDGARLAATLIMGAGLVVVLVAAIGLGPGFTPVPLPNQRARLQTGGLFHFVRHPVYSGLLLFAGAAALRSGSLVVSAAGGALGVLLYAKARWEENHLATRFSDYPAYAARTPRFVPRLRTRTVP